MSGAWPKVLIDRCEINLPYVGELWSTLTALFIVVAGILGIIVVIGVLFALGRLARSRAQS